MFAHMIVRDIHEALPSYDSMNRGIQNSRDIRSHPGRVHSVTRRNSTALPGVGERTGFCSRVPDDTRPVCMFGLLLALFLTLALLAPSDAKPAHAVQMDAIDTCLFTCDACYKGEALLACANTCLQVDGQMIGTAWQQTCPYFRKKPLFMDIF
ncbi:putative protein S-acyltransferase 5 [Frankliniella fusca]|uniref:Uncharacterized protein n=1 Tax=Frankliniella fusca TaxID=407009 RepID=A0AAE1HK05_9NEOP|nr:putative protein S-acyltransferase 5 [Frankliniella fusca]